MVLSAFTDAYTTIICGLVPSNTVYIIMMALQGAGDTSQAVGLSLLADCVAGTPKDFYGTHHDNWICRLMYKVIRYKGRDDVYLPLKGDVGIEGGLKDVNITVDDEDDYIQKELNIQFTIVLFLQTLGLLVGIGVGDLMFHLTGSYQWSIASGGIICFPCMVYLFVYMPETISHDERKPFQLDTLVHSVTSQVTDILTVLYITCHACGYTMCICISSVCLMLGVV